MPFKGHTKPEGSIEDDAMTSPIEFLEEGVANEYAAGVDAGHKVDRRAQVIFIIGIVFAVVFFLGLILPDGILNTIANRSDKGYTLAFFLEDVQTRVTALLASATGHEIIGSQGIGDHVILFGVIAVTGAGLALCGAVYQGAFRNALVTPSTLGVMSGGILGLAVWIAISPTSMATEEVEATGFLGWLYGTPGSIAMSFLGCLLVVGAVLAVSSMSRTNNASPIVLIVSGQVVGAIAGAVVNCIRYWFIETDPDGKGALLTQLTISSFWREYRLIDFLLLALALAVLFAFVMAMRNKMSLLAFEEAERRSLGIDGRKMQLIIVSLCTLLTATLIAFCGHVGFVGFIVPHMARRFVGPDFTYLVPASALLGATFVLAAYVILNTIGFAADAVGAVISILGAGVFATTVFSGKGAARGRFN